jgi:hypothetical protein
MWCQAHCGSHPPPTASSVSSRKSSRSNSSSSKDEAATAKQKRKAQDTEITVTCQNGINCRTKVDENGRIDASGNFRLESLPSVHPWYCNICAEDNEARENSSKRVRQPKIL